MKKKRFKVLHELHDLTAGQSSRLMRISFMGVVGQEIFP
jgi:hypothetical protein